MKDFFKHYFDGFFDDDYPFWKLMTIVVPLAILLTCAIDSCNKSHPIKYDTYEILILDKYDDIGSTYYLIGGRTSETEYHICYKSRNKTKNEKWKEITRTVDGTTYRKYNVGDRIEIRDIEDLRWPPHLP